MILEAWMKLAAPDGIFLLGFVAARERIELKEIAVFAL
jgi:hypothetical protein